MSRSKIKLSERYRNGPKKFIEEACKPLDAEGKSCRCPCIKCLHLYFQTIDMVERHIIVKEFCTTYVNQIFHGEDVGSTSDNVQDEGDVEDENSDGDEKEDEFMNALNNAIPHNSDDDCEEEGLDLSNLFAQKELYAGCKEFNALTFIVHLLHIYKGVEQME